MADTHTLSTKTIFALRDREAAIAQAAKTILEGGIVVIPTETVYGLAANAFNPAAVAAIFAAKGRPNDNPLIVHISDTSMLSKVAVDINDAARALMQAYWPGPLSLVLKKHPNIPNEVSAGLPTVAVRMPENEIARDIIARSGVPLAAPSANLSGKPSPTTAMHAFEDMGGRVPLIIDGGPCTTGVESTVVDLTGAVPAILRPGGITPEMIKSVCGQVQFCAAAAQGQAPASPGMKYRHYAPAAQVSLFSGNKKEVAKNINTMYDIYNEKSLNPAIFCNTNCAALYVGKNTVVLGSTAAQVQASLFAELRNADAAGYGVILFHYEDTMGLAVRNRIEKAAEKPRR